MHAPQVVWPSDFAWNTQISRTLQMKEVVGTTCRHRAVVGLSPPYVELALPWFPFTEVLGSSFDHSSLFEYTWRDYLIPTVIL